jgi:hypothetical protein
MKEEGHQFLNLITSNSIYNNSEFGRFQGVDSI